ncbi:MAG: signal peptidase I [Alkalibacterium gilvum]|uniref:Signal peptidase I n=1 Tax=Alkalibacterium gilvum TaxID=1130080 RepID=A0A1H6R2M8_9LACT|nr:MULTISPECIES: signal peptidase I [Alkalibacterium]MDN6293657.1 signal peptidase I [Alkalibacterium sp.]MDN6295286.1 signal peptidase I [Alkalibacterium sp.]MDN6729135.1 signal peptidase I [Alkalibacterium sp.]SEI50043.1 signal peptidase I [Alkalibacterium gilvum]
MKDSSYRENKNKKPEKEKTLIQELISTLLYIIVITSIFLCIRLYIIAPVSVEGASMEPTLQDGDHLILNKVSDVDRFDVIVFPAPEEDGKQFIKRVIGLPGDEITFQDQTLYINGETIEEDYVDLSKVSDSDLQSLNSDFNLSSLEGVEQVPEDSYFVLGDNRVNSKDSRSFGFISRNNVTGKTSLRIWPLDRLGFIDKSND